MPRISFPEAPESEFLNWLGTIYEIPCRFHFEGSSVEVSPSRADAFVATATKKISIPMPEDDRQHRMAIADRYGANPEAIVTAPNASAALYIVCKALLQPGDGVLVEQPTYDPFFVTPRLHTDNVHLLPRDLLRQPEELSRTLDQVPRPRMMILSDLHNPTADQISEETYADLVELTDQYGFTVVVDEVFRDLAPPYDRFPRPAGTRGSHFITVNSFSKTYGWSGLFNFGWMIAEPEVAERLRRTARNLFNVLSPVDLRLAALALADLEEHRAESVRHTAANRETVRTHLAPLIADGSLQCDLAPYGSTCFPELAGEENAAGAVAALEETGVRVAPGRFFGDARRFRLGFGGDAQKLAEGLAVLTETLKTQR